CHGVERVEGTGYLDLLAAWDAENRAARAAEAEKTRQPEKLPPPEPAPKGGPELLPPPEPAPAGGKASAYGEKKDAGPKAADAAAAAPGVRPFLLQLEQAVE